MPQRKRRPRVNRHFKIDDHLPPADREAYLAYLREPRTTIELAHAWLRGRGHGGFSRSAVARHRRHYLEGLLRREAMVAASNHLARLAEAGEYDPDTMMAGVTARHETLLAKALFDLRFGEELPLEKLNEIGELVSRMVQTRGALMELERLRRSAKAQAPHPAPTVQEDREALERRICEILGEPGDN